ncbi:crosslink repair DNA glycosylase YcaQ family protein [uncultured Piscinibacter sp.]|uniref:DNA glycosylase AlkZ-like family protein n=1 Tax=uncultured Piscinibacter sp. TaxID=1131835 RepID=UPI002638B7B6|nr:crosslink repair DNA glycosylase YcaQ family protein [uncultured Piscinibacter sp.]
MPKTTLDALRRHAIARTFFAPTTLPRAIARLGFVQADPIRAPARAQDLMLRQRVADYRAGELERRYPKLAVEEDYFVNYGFVTRPLHHLMHPRTPRAVWTKARWKQAHAVLEFVRDRGVVHPREVDAEFAHGKTINWFGGSSNASTQLLDGMHYRGLLRVARREGGIRLYAERDAMPAPEDPRAAHDALIDVVVAKYAPLPAPTLGQLLSHLCGGVPQWRGQRAAAMARAKQRLAHARIEGVDWYWPAGERLRSRDPEECVRLLAPFDPLVWDRRRFELFWDWAYRFEAYTPPARRQFGYYALPLLWRDRVLGWANAVNVGGTLDLRFGYVGGKAPREAAFRRELDAEIERLRAFLASTPD